MTHVVGFGDTITPPTSSNSTGIGVLVGTAIGAGVGALIGKSLGAAVGAVGGAIGGGIIGHASSANAAPASGPSPVPAPTPAPTSTTWRRLQPGDTVTAGQRIAFTISGPGNVPLTPDILTALNAALPAAIAQAPSANFQAYPPGTQLPSNWPSDDNFGPGAYRWIVTAPSNSPPFDPTLVTQMMAVTVTAWAQ